MTNAFCKAAAGAVAVAALLLGCVADGTSSNSGGGSAYGSPASSGSASSNEASGPILVDVDTNGTLVATPGQGIGVYVEYATGGHWTVSWTCDTAVTNLSCAFTVDASVMTGVIQSAAGTPFTTGSLSSPASRQALDATTTTTTGTDEVTFDTTPGAVLTLGVTLNAPVSFFFVQDNMVNGGYTGALTNPLMFQPTSP